MIQKIRKSETGRIGIYSVLILTIVFLILWKLLNNYFEEKVIEYAKERISESSDKNYVLSIDDISINLFTQNIILKELIIEPINKDLKINEHYVFKLKFLRISDFSLRAYLEKKNLEIGRLELEEPQFSLFEATTPLNGVNNSKNKFSLYSLFSKKINALTIGEIVIRNGEGKAFKKSEDANLYFSANAFNVSIQKFRVDSITDQKGRLFFSEKCDISIGKFDYKLHKGLYTVFGKRIYASYSDSLITIDSLQLVPTYNKEKFAIEAGRQISRIKMDLGNVSCKGTDVRSFFERNKLIIHKMNLNACLIDVYRDNTMPLEPTVKPSFQALLKKLPFILKVDTVQMYNGKVISEVLSPGETLAVKLDLNRMNGIITGLCNDSSKYTDRTEVKVKLSTYILDKGKIDLTYIFPLKQPDEHFYCSGTMASMPMALFNPMIPRSVNVLIKNGRIDSASFSFVTHQNSSRGTMKLMYHDLQIEIQNKNGKAGLKEKLESYAVNQLIVKENNPEDGKKTRISKINKTHNPYRFFIFYSIQSMISGVVPAIINKRNATYLKRMKR